MLLLCFRSPNTRLLPPATLAFHAHYYFSNFETSVHLENEQKQVSSSLEIISNEGYENFAATILLAVLRLFKVYM